MLNELQNHPSHDLTPPAPVVIIPAEPAPTAVVADLTPKAGKKPARKK